MASASPSGAKLAATLEAIPRNARISPDRRAHIAAASVYNIWGVWPWAAVDTKRLPPGPLSISWLEAMRALARTGRTLQEARELLAAGGGGILEKADIERAKDAARFGHDRLTAEAEKKARTPPRIYRKRALSPPTRASRTPKKARREERYPVRTHEDDGPLLGEIIANPLLGSGSSSREATISADDTTVSSADDDLSDWRQEEDREAGPDTTEPTYRLKDFDLSFTSDEGGTPTPKEQANAVRSRQSTISTASNLPANCVHSTATAMSSAQASAEGPVATPPLGTTGPRSASTPGHKTTEGPRATTPEDLPTAQTPRRPQQGFGSPQVEGSHRMATPQSADGPQATGCPHDADSLLSSNAPPGTPGREAAGGIQPATSPRLAQLASVASARFRASTDWVSSKHPGQGARPASLPALIPASTSSASSSGNAPLPLATAETALLAAEEAVSRCQTAVSELARERSDAEAALQAASSLLKGKQASADALRALVGQADSLVGDFPRLRASRDAFAAQLAAVGADVGAAGAALRRAEAGRGRALEAARAAQAELLARTRGRDEARARADEARRALAASRQRAFDLVVGAGPAGFATILARLLGLDHEGQVETVIEFFVDEYRRSNPAAAGRGAAP